MYRKKDYDMSGLGEMVAVLVSFFLAFLFVLFFHPSVLSLGFGRGYLFTSVLIL